MTVADRWFGALVFLLVLQLVASAVRFWVRATTVKRFGADDLAAFVTLIFASAYCSIGIGIHALAHERPASELPVEVLFPTVNMVLALITLYVCGTTFLKIALGTLLLRILIQKWHRIVIYTVLIITISYGIFFFFLTLFECGNPSQFHIRILIGQCLSARTINGIAYTHSVLQALADIIFALLPISYLRTANLDYRTKVSVGCILGIGSAGCICTLIRIGWIHYLTGVTETFFVTAQGICIMSAAEMSIGITCLSLTTYKPLFRRFFPRSVISNSNENEGPSPYQAEKGSRQNMAVPLRELGIMESVSDDSQDKDRWAKGRDPDVWSMSISRYSSGPASDPAISPV